MAARLLLVCIGAWVLPGTLGFAVPSPSYVLQKKGVATTPDPCRAPIAAPRRRELAGACVRMSADTSTKTEKKKGVGGFDEEKITVERYKLFPRGDMAKLDLDMPSYEGKEALYELYHNADKLVVVQFSKKLCSMCRVIKPLVDKVMKEFSGRIHFVDCEVTANKDIIPQAGLRGVPTVQMFYKGMMVGHWHGLHSKKAMRGQINAALAEYEGASDAQVEVAPDLRMN